jgi:hypothetical protein
VQTGLRARRKRPCGSRKGSKNRSADARGTGNYVYEFIELYNDK